MGKKRVVKQRGQTGDAMAQKAMAKLPRKKMTAGVLNIEASYNNTKISLADHEGRVVAWSSAGALGFTGARKGTTFAAGKVGELLADKGAAIGLSEVDVVVRGIGGGREAAIRAFMSKGVNIASIKDATPVPFNGPKPKKPRRV